MIKLVVNLVFPFETGSDRLISVQPANGEEFK